MKRLRHSAPGLSSTLLFALLLAASPALAQPAEAEDPTALPPAVELEDPAEADEDAAFEEALERKIERAERKAKRAARNLEGHGDDRVAFGSRVVVRAGETVGDVVAFGGTVTVQSGAEVLGDVSAMGGTVEIQSGVRVRGDVVALGGSVVIRSGAEVDGDVSSMGGSIEVEPGAEVHGSRVGLSRGGLPGIPTLSRGDTDHDEPGRGWFASWMLGILWTTMRFLVALVLGLLFIAMMPRRMERMRRPLAASFGKSLLAGLLAVLAFVPLIILLAVSIIGIILIPVLILAYVVVFFVGWALLAMAVGRRLARGAQRTPTVELFVGLTALWIVGLLGTIPWVGGLFDLALAILALGGVGAVVLARFGNQPRPTAGELHPPPYDPGI